MSLLKAMAVEDTDIQTERDSIGGAVLLESGTYTCTVVNAYIKKSDKGALGLFITFKTEDGKEFRMTQYMTGGDAKGNLPYYTDKEGKKQFLPGFNIANSLSLLTIGKEISELDTEEKVIKLYNTDAKAEVPTKVDMVVDLLGQEIIVGVIKQTVDKTKKNDATGEYEATGETRDENEVDKLFRASDKMTTAEIRAQASEAAFFKAWSEKNTGVSRNKAGKSSGGGNAGSPRTAGTSGTPKPKTSLFGGNK